MRRKALPEFDSLPRIVTGPRHIEQAHMIGFRLLGV